MMKDKKFSLKQKSNLKVLASLTVAWTTSQALVTFGSKLFWPESTVIIIATILLNIGLGIGLILANRKYLIEGDELDKKIAIESMSLALGLSIVVGLAYSSASQANLIPFDADISHLVIFTGISILASIGISRKRYL
jgi:hypothetical protein